MKRLNFKKFSMIVLLSISGVLPIQSMDTTTSFSKGGIQLDQGNLERVKIWDLAVHLVKAEDEQHLQEVTAEMSHRLKLQEDVIQAQLAAHRSDEQHAYAQRALPHGVDASRLHNLQGYQLEPPPHLQHHGYQEGYVQGTSRQEAERKYASSPIHDIRELEQMLALVHALMTDVEKMHEMKLQLLHAHNDHIQGILFETARNFEAKSKHIDDTMMSGGHGGRHASEFLQMPDLSDCPDHLVVGKEVGTLFPHFNKTQWDNQPRSIRGGHPTTPIGQIRLQGKLWDVFAGKKGRPVPQQAAHWGPMGWVPQIVHEGPMMTFLPRTNLKSKICEYTFHISEPGAQHWQPSLIVPISLIFKPAADQLPEPRDKSYDPVQDQLAQEIEGEGFKVPDVMDPHASRAAVHEEMKQRLARRQYQEHKTARLHLFGGSPYHRLHDASRLHSFEQLHGFRGGTERLQQLPQHEDEPIYLKPSEVLAQTHGRVHTPDHRYGRVYERLHDIVPAITANTGEVDYAGAQMFRRERMAGHSTKLIPGLK